MKISLGSWAFTYGPHADNPLPFDKTVERLAKAGYDGVEITGFSPHVSLEDYPTTESRREIVRLVEDHNLAVSGYAADFASVNPTVAGNHRKYLDLFRRNVELCVDIGSPAIRVDTGAAPGAIPESEVDDTIRRLADTWHASADVAHEAGVLTVWEFEPGFEFNKPSEVVRLHDAVGHASFKLMLDTSHAHMCAVAGARQHGKKETLKGGIPELLDLLEGRIGHVHLSDSDGTLYVDETSTHLPIGEGKIDFPALAPKLLSIPNLEWWCIDLCFCAGSLDYIDSSLQYVRRLVANNPAE